MTPEAVIHRYLEICTAVHIDREVLARLICCDADLAGRWFTLFGEPASEASLLDILERFGDADLASIAEAQAWAVTPAADSAHLNLDQWRHALLGGCLAEVLSEPEEASSRSAPVRLRTLLATSGVNLAHDVELDALMRFRGTPPDLLEDAGREHRVFSLVDQFELRGEVRARELAARLLALDEAAFNAALHEADERCTRTLVGLGLQTDPSIDWSARLWIHQQMYLLSGLLGDITDATSLLNAHEVMARSLFGYLPALLLFDEDTRRLDNGAGVRIALDSSTSTIARAARDREELDLADGNATAVVDRQILQGMSAEDGLAIPFGGSELLGVMVFARDGEIHASDEDRHDFAAELYLRAVSRHWADARASGRDASDALTRYRETEHLRLREVVHEANNPLSVVRNYLHILELRLKNEPTALEQIALISTELGRAIEIVQTARDMTEPNDLERTSAAEPAPVALNEILRRAITLHSGYAEARFVTLIDDLSESDVVVTTDADALMQVLTNLLKNAIEACRRGDQVTLESAAGVYRAGRAGFEISVRDTGPGLPEEVLARLFEPKRSSKGDDHAGLGLHIVGRLVEALGGQLDVRTAPERGTRFTLFLPL